jgi:hypothetical protein
MGECLLSRLCRRALCAVVCIVMAVSLSGCAGMFSGGGQDTVLYTSRGIVEAIDADEVQVALLDDPKKEFFDDEVVTFDMSRIVSGPAASSLAVGDFVELTYLSPANEGEPVTANSIELIEQQ